MAGELLGRESREFEANPTEGIQAATRDPKVVFVFVDAMKRIQTNPLSNSLTFAPFASLNPGASKVVTDSQSYIGSSALGP